MVRKINVVGRCLYAVVLVIGSFSAYAQDVASELNQMYDDVEVDAKQPSAWHGFLGAGVLATQQTSGDRKNFIVPLIAIAYKDIAYWQVARGGVWLLQSDDRRVRAGLVVKVRRGFDPADFDGLAGMEERKSSREAGINGVWATRAITVSAAYYTDISATSQGDSATLSFAHPFRVSERWRITPSVGAEWLDAAVVGYYYGVRPSEATVLRPTYAGKSNVNVRVGASVLYSLSRDWWWFGGIGYTRLGSGITDSPIVIHDHVSSVHLGAGWHF
jgi:outer membrane protein